jgi:hypothetical protein
MIDLDVNPIDAATQQPLANPILTCGIYDAKGLPCPIEPMARPQTNVYHNSVPYAPAGFTGPFMVYGTVSVPGYNLTYFGPTPWDGATSLSIPVPMVASFNQPSRDRVCQVKAAFQGLTASIPGYGEVPLFGPFCYGLPLAGRQAWRAAELAAGSTHAVRAISVEYLNDAGYSYPTPGCDFTQNLPGLKSLIAEDLLAGITPVLYLAGDGQTYSPNGGTYGYTWLMQNMARIMAALSDKTINGFDATRYQPYCLGFELITDGGWSPDNFETATVALRAQPSMAAGYIASHIGGYTWWGDGSGSSAGPIGDWSSPAGQAIDICFEEGDAPFVNVATGQPIDGVNNDGWQQRAAAHLGPAATNILPRNRIQYEWPQPLDQQTPRGQRYAVALELDEDRWVRGQVSLQELNFERAAIRNYGFPYIG